MDVAWNLNNLYFIYFQLANKDTGILFVRIPLIASCASLFNLYRLEPIFLNRIRCKYRTAIHVEDSIEIKMPRSRELIASWILDLRFDSGFHISLEKSLTAVIIDACLMDGFYIGAKKFHVPFDTDLSSGERYCIRNENILGGYSFFSVNKFSACSPYILWNVKLIRYNINNTQLRSYKHEEN